MGIIKQVLLGILGSFCWPEREVGEEEADILGKSSPVLFRTFGFNLIKRCRIEIDLDRDFSQIQSSSTLSFNILPKRRHIILLYHYSNSARNQILLTRLC